LLDEHVLHTAFDILVKTLNSLTQTIQLLLLTGQNVKENAYCAFNISSFICFDC